MLNVSHTEICDDSLVALENHPSLASLSLLSTNVTDDGLCHLQGEILELLFATLEARRKLAKTSGTVTYTRDREKRDL